MKQKWAYDNESCTESLNKILGITVSDMRPYLMEGFWFEKSLLWLELMLFLHNIYTASLAIFGSAVTFSRGEVLKQDLKKPDFLNSCGKPNFFW